ncbi:MupG family TIM beta-alpha barrel fold protein [Lactobacillus sp. R2/2]|nr:MupG family TIM beta-alpha barrel fold protein [Lactobacillus sp. R2/2]
MKGISVYPNKSSVADCINYIDKAADLGFNRLFTSLLELTEDQSKTLNKFKTVLTHARARKMWVSLDVNPALFTSLHVSYNDLSFLKN